MVKTFKSVLFLDEHHSTPSAEKVPYKSQVEYAS